MINFTKYAWEEVHRYFEFKRPDGKDGLAVGETVSSVTSMTSTDSNGIDCSSDMLASVVVANNTQVSYTLKAGTVGMSYVLDIKVVTSLGQHLEGKVNISVI